VGGGPKDGAKGGWAVGPSGVREKPSIAVKAR